MSASPERWTDQLWRSTLVVLATAAGLYFAWHFISAVLPAIILLAMLLFIMRLALGISRKRSSW